MALYRSAFAPEVGINTKLTGTAFRRVQHLPSKEGAIQLRRFISLVQSEAGVRK